MLAKGAVIITGVNGGVGRGVATYLSECGYHVVGIDRGEGPFSDFKGSYISFDLSNVNDGLAQLSREISALGINKFSGLVNNAATQIVRSFDGLSVKDWQDTLDVNLLAPIFLSRKFIYEISPKEGVILNISSIHSALTKPGFVAYATSKAALTGFTRALAVECGGSHTICAILPAAIGTDMLISGFEGNEGAFSQLERYHPTGKIGAVDDVARMVEYILGQGGGFINGAIFNLDGGIGGRLHDPA